MKKVARLRIINSEESNTEKETMAHVNASENLGVRTTGRIKKPKAVFDPSDNYLPRAHRPTSSVAVAINSSTSANTSPQRKRDTFSSGRDTIILSPSSVDSSSDSVEVCEVCAKREAKRGAHAKNKFLACNSCKKSVHKLCLQQEFEDFETLQRYYKCDDCRKCSKCVDSLKRKNEHLTCTKCVKTFHGTCHVPPVKSRNSNLIRKWKCFKCATTSTTNTAFTTLDASSTISTTSPTNNTIESREKPTKVAREIQLNIERPVQAIATSSTTSIAGGAAAQHQHQQQQQQQHENNEKPSHSAKPTTLLPLSRKGLTQATMSSTQANGANNKNGKVRSYNTIIDYEKSINKSVLDNGTTTVVVASAAAAAAAGAAPVVPKAIKKNNVVYKEYNISEHIDLPDVKNWSVEQVANFMYTYFPKDAHIFREHEIDGESLLLMKRSDVVKKLAIKLGPALRIYSLILKLQTQTNDPTLGWNCDV